MIKSPHLKRQIDSDKESSSEDEWVGPKQTEINDSNGDSNSEDNSVIPIVQKPVIKKRKSILLI